MFPGVIVTEVRDHGSAGMIKSTYRGSEWSAAVRWIKVEMLVSSLRVDEAVEALRNAARTECRADDGTLIVSEGSRRDSNPRWRARAFYLVLAARCYCQ